MPLLRSKYLQIELLKFLFRNRHEVCLFLRTLSKTGSEFYRRFQNELMRLFMVYDIIVTPPMKLEMSFKASSEADSINDFLTRKVKNLRQLLAHSDFRGHFALKLVIRVDRFDLERDILNQVMFLPATQILYDVDNRFTELVLQFHTQRLRDFHGEIIRRHMMSNFVKDYLLLQGTQAREHLAETETAGAMVTCERLVVTNTDTALLPFLIGYFYERDQQQMLTQFPVLAFMKKEKVTMPAFKAENLALPLLSTQLLSFELSQCEIDVSILPLIKSFLTSCQNITNLTISHISARGDWQEVSEGLLKVLKQSFPFLTGLKTLNMSRCRYGDRLVEQLADLLLAAPSLTSLDLTNIALTGYGLRHFADAYLKNNPRHLHSLNLTSNKFSDLLDAYHFGQGLSQCSALKEIILRRMRISPKVLEELLKGFQAKLTHINLDYNNIEKDGVSIINKQLQYGQGGDWLDPAYPASNSKGLLLQSRVPWCWTHLSMRENEITDFAMEDMCAVVHQLSLLRRLDIDGNLFYRVRQFN